jgi:DNA-binding CsgD family transcriptional regulator
MMAQTVDEMPGPRLIDRVVQSGVPSTATEQVSRDPGGRVRRSGPVGCLNSLLSSFALHSGLSGRQVDILRIALLQGLTDKEAAHRLRCDYRTIRTHWMRLCSKLKCRHRNAAIAKFVKYLIAHIAADGRSQAEASPMSRSSEQEIDPGPGKTG